MTHERAVPTPGKTSGVTAEDLVNARDIGGVAPGRINLVQSHEVGDQYIDHGGVCDGKDDRTAGCFLSDRQRDRLMNDFKLHVMMAAENYKTALTDMRVDELVKKDDDLNWVLSLALDLVGAHLVVVATSALKSLRSSTASRLGDAVRDASQRGNLDGGSAAERALSVLERVSDKGIESKTKAGFDTAKAQAKAGLKVAFTAGAHAEKALSLSFIDQLKNSCDEGFTSFANRAAGWANDAEIVVLWEGMKPAHHTPAQYKAALEAKLARFKRSGVADIGRRETLDREFKVASVHRDTRVVWVRDFPGDGKKLYYQSQEGDYNPSVIGPGDPMSEQLPGRESAAPRSFGSKNPREAPQLDRPVPDEFLEAALARNEAVYGPVETVDPVRDSLRNQGFDPEIIERRRTSRGQPTQSGTKPLYSGRSVFAQASGQGYPSGSTFDSAKTDPLVWSDPNSIFTGRHK